jgi:hypothetical protein
VAEKKLLYGQQGWTEVAAELTIARATVTTTFATAAEVAAGTVVVTTLASLGRRHQSHDRFGVRL